MKFRDSELAHRLLDGKRGIEIGGSAHNPFNIDNCEFVDYTNDMDTVFKQEELRLCGTKRQVDKIAVAWDLPYEDESLDYVLSSHVIEHCWDVLGTIKEWLRVLVPGGLIFMIIPHKERTFDKDRERTTYEELVARENNLQEREFFTTLHEHFSVWIAEDWFEICDKAGFNLAFLQDPDDKVGNGFTIVIRK